MMIDNELLFLGLLAEGPKHGYEIKRQLEEELLPTIGLKINSIYYPLKKMEQEGLLEKEVGKREGHFPERYVYRITLKGKKRFDHLIEQSFLSVERPFFQIDLSLYFLNMVDKSMARRRLKTRLALLKKIRKDMMTLQKTAKSPNLTLILTHDLGLVEAEIASTDNLIAQI
jgi:DNA-binding PadR family transcriptional regulator